MIENVLRNLGGIGVYGVVSVCLFFAFFTGMVIWACRLKRDYLKTMQSLPLDGDRTEAGSRRSEEEGSRRRQEADIPTSPPNPPPYVGGYNVNESTGNYE